MTIGQRFLRLLSHFTFKPIAHGYGVTTEASEAFSLKSDPDVPKLQNLVFYKLRQDVGPFEIRSIKEDNGKISFIVYNSMNDRSLKINKQWFEFLFEETDNIDPDFKKISNFENRT